MSALLLPGESLIEVEVGVTVGKVLAVPVRCKAARGFVA